MRSTRRQNVTGEKSQKGSMAAVEKIVKSAKLAEKEKIKKMPNVKEGNGAVRKAQIANTKEESSKKQVNERSSLRSTSQTNLLYDFQDDSPKVLNERKQEKVQKKAGKRKETEGKTIPTIPVKTSRDVLEKRTKGSFLTPGEVHKGNSKKNGVKKKLKPLPPPNFDDLSPITRNSSKKRPTKPGKQETPRQNENRRASRSSTKSQVSLDTPSVSYNEADNTFNDDSAIFLSPRKKLRRFSTDMKKTSTPAIVPPKKSNKDTKVKQSKEKMIKITSTPCEVKAKPVFTKMKTVEPEFSPVQRSDTPTSDYASMDSMIEPSPSPEKPVKRKKGSPAFTLEDDYADVEPLGLNRSINSNYSNPKKKKKLKTNRYSVEKVEEWASKVNSELEDVENFELSIED